MRIVYTIKNSITALLLQIIVLVTGAIIPRWIIATYGSNVNGLTANITQFINIINLLQAGMVGASIYEMYRPIANMDYKTIAQIFYSSERYFNRKSVLFLGMTLLIVPYILLGTETGLSSVDIVFSVVILGLNATIQFRYNCKYDIIFSAHQKKYMLYISMGFERIIYYILLFLVFFFKLHYIAMYLAGLLAGIGKILFLSWKFRQSYGVELCKWKTTENYIVANQSKLFGNQVIITILEAAPIVIVTKIYGLTYASVMSVNLLAINVFKTIFTSLQNSVAASFGDYIAQHDSSDKRNVFSIIQFVLTGFAFICCVCLGALLGPFVMLYTNEIADISYSYDILKNIMVLYIASFVLYLPYNLYINSAGLYGRVFKGNIFIATFSFAIMITSAFVSFQYIYLGLILYYLVTIMHRYFVLRQSDEYVSKRNILSPVIVFVLICLLEPLYNYISGLIFDWRSWMLVGGLLFMSISAITILIFKIAARNEFDSIIGYAKVLLDRKG